jgi:hypothetical protein
MATTDLAPAHGQAGAERGPLPLGRRGSSVSPAHAPPPATIGAMRRSLPTLAVLLPLVLGACAATTVPSGRPGSPSPARSPAGSTAGSTAGSVPTASSAPLPTAVPGGRTADPDSVPTRIPTTQTEWGEILDALPATFPIYPGAGIVEVPGGPVSGSFDARADADTVATWYADVLRGRGYAVELSQPLEDGSRTLDAAADLPECRIRMTFTPADGSAIMTVLYAAACAGLGG